MNPIPDDVRRFILTSIPSVPYLEAALLMRANPERELSPAEVAGRLYVPENAAAELLIALRRAGMVQCTQPPDARYRYAAGNPALDAALSALARAYADNLVGVTTLIHDATQKSAQRFADAFRFRKEK